MRIASLIFYVIKKWFLQNSGPACGGIHSSSDPTASLVHSGINLQKYREQAEERALASSVPIVWAHQEAVQKKFNVKFHTP